MAKKAQIDNVNELAKALRELDDSSRRSETQFKSLGDAIKKYAIAATDDFQKSLGKVPSSLLFVVGAFKGFKKTLSSGMSVIKFTVGGIQSLASTVLGLADAFIGFTIEGFRTLMNEVNTIMKATLAAIEGLQNSFGDLGVGIGKAAMNFAKGATVFGKKAYRYHDVLDFVNEALGSTSTAFRELVTRMSDKEQRAFGNTLGRLTKGLGLTGENLDGLATYAMSAGTSIQGLSNDFIRASLEIASQTGHTAKDVGKDMADMMTDIESFGLVSVETAKKTIKEMKNLGVETKALSGMAKHFDTFKNAAVAAGNLAAVLNIRVDSFALMRAKDADRVEMFRQSLFATGQTYEDLSRPAQRFLASQAQIDMKTASLVFSLKNQNESYKELQKRQKKAISPQEKMANIMEKMDKNIARFTRYIPDLVSFWDAFKVGIKRALSWTGPFADMLNKVWFAMQRTFEMAGQMTGIFIKSFPGMMDTIRGFSELFSAKHFKGFTNDLIKVWKIFINTGLTDFNNLFNNLSVAWANFTSGGPGKKIKSSLTTFMTAIREVLIAGINFITDIATDGMTTLTDILSGKVAAPTTSFGKFIQPLIGTIQNAWVKIKPPLFKLIAQIAENAIKFLSEAWSGLSGKTKMIVFAWLAGPAILQGMGLVISKWAGSIILWLAKSKIAQGIGSFFTSNVWPAATKSIESGIGSDMPRTIAERFFGAGGGVSGFASHAAKIVGGAGAVIGAAMAGWELGTYLDKTFGISDWLVDTFSTLDDEVKQHFSSLANRLEGSIKSFNKKDWDLTLPSDIADREEAIEKIAKDYKNVYSEAEAAISKQLGFDKKRGALSVINQKQVNENVKALLKEKGIILPEDVNKVFEESKTKFKGMIAAKDIAEQAKEEIENATVGIEDLSFLKKVKKIDPKKLQELRENFDTKIKPEIIKIKGIMQSILEEFKEIPVSRIEEIVSSINSINQIPVSLSEFSRLGKKINTSEIVKRIETTINAVITIDEVIASHKQDFTLSNKSLVSFNEFVAEVTKSRDAFTLIKKSTKTIADIRIKDIQKTEKAIGSVLSIINSDNLPTERQISRFKASMQALQTYKADVIDIGKAISDPKGTSVSVASVKTADGKVDMNVIISLNVEGHALNNVLSDVYGLTTRYKNNKQAGGR